jgi:hypothetical protein
MCDLRNEGARVSSIRGRDLTHRQGELTVKTANNSEADYSGRRQSEAPQRVL